MKIAKIRKITPLFCFVLIGLPWNGCIADNPTILLVVSSHLTDTGEERVLRSSDKMNFQSLLIFSYFMYSIQLNILKRGKLKPTWGDHEWEFLSPWNMLWDYFFLSPGTFDIRDRNYSILLK